MHSQHTQPTAQRLALESQCAKCSSSGKSALKLQHAPVAPAKAAKAFSKSKRASTVVSLQSRVLDEGHLVLSTLDACWRGLFGMSWWEPFLGPQDRRKSLWRNQNPSAGCELQKAAVLHFWDVSPADQCRHTFRYSTAG